MPFTKYSEDLSAITNAILNDILNLLNGNPDSGQVYNLHATTEYLLEQIRLAIGGGGGGPIMAVTGTKPIVIDSTIPNQPDVQLEVARDTAANILAMQTAGTLANGGLYTITDPPLPCSEITLQANYNIVDNKVVLNATGWGYIPLLGTQRVFIGYDLSINELNFIYHPLYNQLAVSTPGSGSTCLTDMDWGNPAWINVSFYNSIIVNRTASCSLANVVMQDQAAIDFSSQTNIVVSNCLFKPGAFLNLSSTNSLNFLNCTFGEGSVITADSSLENVSVGDDTILVTGAGNDQTRCSFGDNYSITLQAPHTDCVLFPGYSNFPLDLDISGNYDGGTLTLTLPANTDYIGIFTGTTAAGGNIRVIPNINNTHPVKFIMDNTIANTFQTRPIATPPVAGNLTGTAGSYLITGHAETSDFIIISKAAGNDWNQVDSAVINL